MSDLIAREALSRMNMNVVAISPVYAGLAADLALMVKTDPAEAQAKFMEQRRAELCAAYGFNESNQRKPFAFAGGIAIIPISGTLINRFGQSYGFVTGYNFIRQQTNLALADDDVKGILYDVNSFGGEVAGCFECADVIAGATKPTMSYVDSNSYSAGYALASAANKMVVTPSAGVGSIGCVAMHVDMSKALDEFGVKVTFITFGAHKVDGNPYEPLSDEARKSIQTSVNKSGEKFVAVVAKQTGLDAKVIRDTEARTYRAEDALSLGLIDAIMAPEEAVASFFGELSGSTLQPRKKEDAMSQAEGQQAGAPTTPGATTTTTAAAPVAAPAVASTTTTAAAPVDAAEVRAAERARMSGIMNCEEAKGRSALANHFAMETDMSVAAAQKALAAAPKETAGTHTNRFDETMNKGQHPNVGADGGAGADGEQSHAQRILATQKRVTGIDHAAK